MFFGIRKKILLSGVLTIIVTISLMSVIFIYNLIEFHKNNSKLEINLVHSNLTHNFEAYTNKVHSTADILSKDEKLLANLTLIKNYSHIYNINFQDIYQNITSDLLILSQVINSDFMVILDSSGVLVSFYKSQKMNQKTQPCVGYSLQNNDSTIIYTKDISSNTFNLKTDKTNEVDFFTKYINSNQHQDIAIVHYNSEIFLNIQHTIYDANNTKLGTIAMVKLIDQEFLQSLNTNDSIHLLAKSKNLLYALSDELQNSTALIQASLLQDLEKLVINNKELFIVTHNLLKDFDITYMMSFEQLDQEIDSLKKSTIFSMLIIFLIIIPLGYLFVKKYINNPIEKLLDDIKNFKHKNHFFNNNEKLNDEFGTFQKVFYDMTNTLLNKETELYLKSQEQKLANKELENIVSQLKAYQIALDETSIVSKSDLEGKITYVNTQLCVKTGYTKEELIGKPHSIFKHPDTPKEEFVKLWRSVTKGEIYKGIIKNKTKDGKGYYVKTTIVPIFDNNNSIKEYIAVRNDITDIMKAKQELEDSYYTDILTKLPNRNKLIIDIEKIQDAKLILLNIDSFKEINDFYGHSTGDEILILIGQKIKTYFDTIAKIYKMPSDEYALMFDNSVHLDNDIKKELSKFIEEISDTYFSINNIDITVNLTAGLALSSLNNEVLKDADIALKTAKKLGIVMVEFDESIQTEANQYKNNILWAHKLKAAIKDDRIVPYYQPIYNNQTQKIEKYEVLMRLIEDNRPISPWFFLDIAKKTKLYKKLTKIMIEKSFEYFSDKDYEFSINLTAEDIESSEIKEFIINKLKQYPNIVDKIVFEIVESEGFKDFDNVIEFIKEAKINGCKIAIDDFGTGYSNFEYLLKLKADYVKIDGSLIKHINQDKNAFEVVKIIVQFAKSQNMRTIAEFVSNKEIQDMIYELGVDYSQGYFIAEPNPEIIS
ncbi:EAL domain-containing protein [Arcobacter sp. FWKO B]|uniref:bifunctional diguanylate cyclase/phosphodiesterase n=1 Tax=Arcobacter sp. FWKO B TaxID=2593672 RepID=UPI0018A398F2|nr:EAL domain-containing protein [Arcobacter sp. FWKO B]QOG12534.1 EAL domain-containing protein [Arcobacter sp. FWKO B]